MKNLTLAAYRGVLPNATALPSPIPTARPSRTMSQRSRAIVRYSLKVMRFTVLAVKGGLVKPDNRVHGVANRNEDILRNRNRAAPLAGPNEQGVPPDVPAAGGCSRPLTDRERR